MSLSSSALLLLAHRSKFSKARRFATAGFLRLGAGRRRCLFDERLPGRDTQPGARRAIFAAGRLFDLRGQFRRAHYADYFTTLRLGFVVHDLR